MTTVRELLKEALATAARELATVDAHEYQVHQWAKAERARLRSTRIRIEHQLEIMGDGNDQLPLLGFGGASPPAFDAPPKPMNIREDDEPPTSDDFRR